MEIIYRTGNETVDQLSQMRITGNVIPSAWYQTIRKESGKPYLNAIVILADIVYWYRAAEVRSEGTGELVGYKKKFKADLLQRNYQQIADQFGISKRDASNAVVELEKLGVVKRVFRKLNMGGIIIPNVLFLALDVEVLRRLTFPEDGEPDGDIGGIDGREEIRLKNAEKEKGEIKGAERVDGYGGMESEGMNVYKREGGDGKEKQRMAGVERNDEEMEMYEGEVSLKEGYITENGDTHFRNTEKCVTSFRGTNTEIPTIDHGKLSVLEAQNNFAKEIDWANPGALAAGTKVLVYTSPVNQADAEPPVYYEMIPDSLFWTADDFDTKELIPTGASELAFTMPEKDITISVSYQAMTNGVVLDKGELRFEVEQIRSGSRWNPQIGWKVTDPQRLTATIIPDSVANKNLVWNVKDTDGSSTDIIRVDENGEVSVNQSAKWIQELIKAGVANQELYPSKKITTEAKDYATVTVTTEAGQKRASAFVTVDFKITDDTVVPVSNIELDQSELSFEITRTLEGDRKNPKETYTVTPSKRLYEKITPEYADNKEVSWSAGDPDMLRVDKEGMVSVRENAKWITDLVQAEKESHKDNPYAECNASGSRSSYVTVTAKDGEKQAVCAVNVSFKTVDHTMVHVDSVSLNQKELKFSVEKVMTGNRTSPKVEYKVTGAQKLAAVLTPSEAQNKKVNWSVADLSMAAVSADGSVTVKRDAKWIQELEAKDAVNLAKNRYAVSTAAGTKETKVTAVTEDGKKTAECRIVVEFKTTDQTVRTSGSSGSGSSGGGGSSSRRVSSSGGGSSSKDKTNGPGVVNQSEGTWLKDSTGWWYRYKDGSYPKSCWKQLPYNGTMEWYHFDNRGYMETGWFTDTDKHVYYLNPVSDGTCGRMVTGWKQIEGKWYYFNTVSDGTKGAMFMNRRTPDGYQVDGKGVWVQ